MEWKLLDVGCGNVPHKDADVCGDLYIEASPQRDSSVPIAIKSLKNFVLFDAYNLPFRNESFKIVYASQLLEHLEQPLTALKEWKRVAKEKVIVRVPWLGKYQEYENPTHLYTWSTWSLHNLLRKVFPIVTVYPRTLPITWLRFGLMPKIFNYLMQRVLSRMFGIFRVNELIGIAEKD